MSGESVAKQMAMPLNGVWGWLFPELSVASGAKAFNIASLDGIRACAILLVLGSHVGFSVNVPGGFGVTVFFFLSGYLITTLLRREWERTGAINLKYFYVRRGLRIIPPNYIVVFIAVLLAILLKQSFTIDGIAANLLYFTNYYGAFGISGAPPGMGTLWSLAVEEHFYLFFPLAFMITAKLGRWRQAMVLSVVCAIVLLWRCVLVFFFHCPEERTYFATDTRLDSILWGSVCAVVCNPALGDPLASRMSGWKSGGVGLAIICFTLVFRADWFRETFRYTLQAIALFPVFAVAIKKAESYPVAILNWYLMRLIGVYSYTIYLTHQMVIGYAKDAVQMRGWGLLFICFSICFVLAALMYQLVDVPCVKLRKRFSA